MTADPAGSAPAGPEIPARDPENGVAGGLLATASRLLALAGGFLLLGVMAMTVVSVAGRHLFDAPILGDYEITELAIGVAVFAFLPWCHLRNGNIVVEFFTHRLPARGRATLDAVHSVAFAAVAGVIAWRLIVGGRHKDADGETTLFLQIPATWGYYPAAAGAVLLVAVALYAIVRCVRAIPDGDAARR